MITSAEILTATGLRSSKTLTRWHQRGIIPPPTMGKHPSGRGKTAYWPDWVLDRCLRVVELQAEGHSLASAHQAIEMERMEKLLSEVRVGDPTSALEQIPVKVGDREVPLFDLLAYEVLSYARPMLPSGEATRELLVRLKEGNVIATALRLLGGGYNPVALIGAERVETVPDFVVSHRFATGTRDPAAMLAVPLVPPLTAAFRKLGRDLPLEPTATPAPFFWVRRGEERVQYAFYPGGLVGFEVLHETAKVMGVEG